MSMTIHPASAMREHGGCFGGTRGGAGCSTASIAAAGAFLPVPLRHPGAAGEPPREAIEAPRSDRQGRQRRSLLSAGSAVIAGRPTVAGVGSAQERSRFGRKHRGWWCVRPPAVSPRHRGPSESADWGPHGRDSGLRRVLLRAVVDRRHLAIEHSVAIKRVSSMG